ncbi:DNA replication/repair protein RecF [Pelosinus sp. IPA-1]|uniref:DNA replication/repair protein RecF n=1 Tax=Pelosinus sp. IPA-1 TaxID=3029569 RepID=UPI00243614B5|nr:DNA replication/repair protein RecF [Pelosinus sp. IPA-1]GMB00166.1 DNA replication and repair protein RecF [Pelosinus sp. IPA-1]
MKVNKIVLRNYRNYVDLSLDFTQGINIFIGQNAQGKTNILESIYYGAMGRSHRTNVDAELIRWQQENGSITILFSRMNIENSLVIKLSNHQKKEIISNNYGIKPRELIGLLNVVLFSPEDLMLIKGMPAMRRRFLDIEISQANPTYYQQLLKYNRIVTQRNNLLKKIRENKEKHDMLDAWDDQLAVTASKIVTKRLDAVKKLAMLANLMHRKITASKENLTLVYQKHEIQETEMEKLKIEYKNKLLQFRQNDIWRGSTSIGPHKDDLILTVNGVNLRTFGSQGQQRTGVLSLKLAELEFIKSETGEYPILLLDDVMSELDASRREHLLAFIKDRVQTIITATEEKYFPNWEFGKYYHVANGTIVE